MTKEIEFLEKYINDTKRELDFCSELRRKNAGIEPLYSDLVSTEDKLLEQLKGLKNNLDKKLIEYESFIKDN